MASPTNLEEDGPITSINITPLVDVVLVLLIILMVTAGYVAQRSIPVDLPKGSTGEATATTLAISVDRHGRLFLEAEPIGRELLRSKIRAVRATSPDTRAVIAADGAAEHRHVVSVIDLLRQERVDRFAINVDPDDLGRSP